MRMPLRTVNIGSGSSPACWARRVGEPVMEVSLRPVLSLSSTADNHPRARVFLPILTCNIRAGTSVFFHIWSVERTLPYQVVKIILPLTYRVQLYLRLQK